jgi:hypothetical protein
MKLTPTDHKVELEGTQVPVYRFDSGRYIVRSHDGREWHARDLDTLQARIDKTTQPRSI